MEIRRSIELRGFRGMGFCFWWTLSTAAAAIIGLSIVNVYILAQFPNEFNYRNDNEIGPTFAWGCGFVILIGPLVGLAQASVLRRLQDFRKSDMWLWITATSLSVPFAVIASLFLAILSTPATIIWAITPGLALGFAQWLVLMHLVQKAGWWVLASGVGWVTGAFVAYAVRTTFFQPIEYSYPFYPLQAAVAWGVGWAAGAVLYGLITRAMLVGLISNSRHLNSRPHIERKIKSEY